MKKKNLFLIQSGNFLIFLATTHFEIPRYFSRVNTQVFGFDFRRETNVFGSQKRKRLCNALADVCRRWKSSKTAFTKSGKKKTAQRSRFKRVEILPPSSEFPGKTENVWRHVTNDPATRQCHEHHHIGIHMTDGRAGILYAKYGQEFADGWIRVILALMGVFLSCAAAAATCPPTLMTGENVLETRKTLTRTLQPTLPAWRWE